MTPLEMVLMNNYVFQNRFKAYFSNDLSQIINCLSPVGDIKKSRSIPYNINGRFGEKTRTINFPNIFTYAYSVNKISNLSIIDFGKMNSVWNKMEIDFTNRKFKSNSYSLFLEERINNLISNYDKMYKIDIQSFYKSIYTHVFEKMDAVNLTKVDEYIRVFNNSKTNGLLLGNLLSTYAANEIVDYLSKAIQIKLPNCKINYFSDQFYVYYNNFDYEDSYVYQTIKSILEKDYFELKINEKESEILMHEDVIKEMDFKRYIAELCKIQKSRRGNIDNSLSNLVHFFNLFIQYYYLIQVNKRQSFVEVVLKSVFSSTVNLYRMVRISNNADFTLKFNKMVSILIFFLKQHPSLIILYIEMGLWDLIIEKSLLDDKKRNELFNYFYQLLNINYTTIEGVYYFHICFQLKKASEQEKFAYQLYKTNKNMNQLIESLIVETFNIKEKRNNVINCVFDDANWLINYTKLVQIRYHLVLNSSSSCLLKTIDRCQRSKIKIIRSLYDITFDVGKKNKYEQLVQKFESKKYQGKDEKKNDYFDYNLL